MATTPVREALPAELGPLVSPAVAVLNEHTDAAGCCAVCGYAWSCELVVLAEHNMAAL